MHKTNKKISIIVPVYNAELYLNKCLDSIKNQKYSNLEIILINDGSTDDSGLICDLYAASDSRFVVIHKKNAGVSAARNDGLLLATGDYITFVDSDDYVDDDMYSSMVEIINKHDCDVVMCDCIKEFDNRQEIYTHNIRAGYYNSDDLLNEYFPNLLITADFQYPPAISNCLLLFKSECCKDNANLKIKYAEGIKYSEDLFFGAQLLYNAKSFFYLKNKCYYHYVANVSSATHTLYIKKWDNFLELHRLITDYFINSHKFDFCDQINRLLLFFLYIAIGDILKSKSLDKEFKMNTILNILNCYELKHIFKNLKIHTLKISYKQKILTFCFKYKIGLSFLIAYYERK